MDALDPCPALAQPPARPGVVTAIDAHAHVFRRGLPLAAGRRYEPDYDAPLPDYLRMLDRHGISHGVLVQPSFLGTDNTYLLAALRAAPARLRGIAVVPTGASVDELDKLASTGVVGVRLNLIGQPDPDFASLAWQRHLRLVASLGWQVELHAEARRLPLLLPPLLDAGTAVVVDHFGRPDPDLSIGNPGFECLAAAGPTGGVWVKLSGAYRNGSGRHGWASATAAVRRLCAGLGPGRLLWGSDWPHTQYETVVDTGAVHGALLDWLPDEAARRTVLVDTPARLFGFHA